jgi:hypothetical protein
MSDKLKNEPYFKKVSTVAGNTNPKIHMSVYAHTIHSQLSEGLLGVFIAEVLVFHYVTVFCCSLILPAVRMVFF